MRSEKELPGFFTLYKFFWWITYNLMGIGFLAVWIFINVSVMGNDFVLGGMVPRR